MEVCIRCWMRDKEKYISEFRDHVSSGKARFFRQYGMEFIMGDRSGPYLHDLNSEKNLFNLHSNGGVFNLGHRNREIIGTLQDSLKSLDIGNHHLMSRSRTELAKMLTSSCPADLDYCIFGVSGGESVDLAIKIARGYTGRKKIVSAEGGYHGHTGLAVRTGEEKYRKPFNIESDNFVKIPFNDLKAAQNIIDNDTAAVILETIPATAGIIIPDSNYYTELKGWCEKNGTLLILDEIQSGLGRTGKFWAFEHFNVIPDIVITGKGLSGGIYPITATIIRKPLEEVFHSDPFVHVSTFGGSELGCEVGKKVVEISSDRSFLNHVNQLSDYFEEKVNELIAKHPGFLVGLNRLGLMMGLVLKNELAGPLLTKTSYDQGLLLIYSNNNPGICQLLPPLTITKEEVDHIIPLLDSALQKARKLYPLLKIKRNTDKLLTPLKTFFS